MLEEQTARAHEIAEKLYANNPEYLKDFFAGMAETSGISLERLKLCNASEYIEGCFFCSAMAVWGDYSEDGLVFGRNYDAESYADIDKDVLVTVFHPDDGLISATVGYAGEIYCVNGLNENGIFIELNNGMPSAGWDIHWDMCPATTELFDLLFKARSLDDVDDFFHEVRSSASFIIGVADSWNSLARRANMLVRAEEYKGRTDVATMKAIMSTPIDGGGPWHIHTRYQLVVEPAEMAVHIKVSCGENWVGLPLAKYLGKRK